MGRRGGGRGKWAFAVTKGSHGDPPNDIFKKCTILFISHGGPKWSHLGAPNGFRGRPRGPQAVPCVPQMVPKCIQRPPQKLRTQVYISALGHIWNGPAQGIDFSAVFGFIWALVLVPSWKRGVGHAGRS